MALHPDFPESPYSMLDPAIRWFPADESLRETSMDKLMPPMAPQLRKKVTEWRNSGYVGAADTSRSLLNWWFNTPHLLPKAVGSMVEFQYYFTQREALETIIYLYDECDDVVSYAKNYLAVHFNLDYINADGNISNYYPDFMMKLSNDTIVIVETKGQEDTDVPLKMTRLKQWCEDINRVQSDVKYDFVYVDEENFEKYNPKSFKQLLDVFREYKENEPIITDDID